MSTPRVKSLSKAKRKQYETLKLSLKKSNVKNATLQLRRKSVQPLSARGDGPVKLLRTKTDQDAGLYQEEAALGWYDNVAEPHHKKKTKKKKKKSKSANRSRGSPSTTSRTSTTSTIDLFPFLFDENEQGPHTPKHQPLDPTPEVKRQSLSVKPPLGISVSCPNSPQVARLRIGVDGEESDTSSIASESTRKESIGDARSPPPRPQHSQSLSLSLNSAVDAQSPEPTSPGGQSTTSTARKARRRSKTSNIKVIVRVRPMLGHEQGTDKEVVEVRKDAVVVLHEVSATQSSLGKKRKKKKVKFAFDVALGKGCTQEEVCRHASDGVIDSLVNGINCTMFAYGPTGSGKTFTMTGSKDKPGVIPQLMQAMFEQVREDPGCTVSALYLEIYNEEFVDLLSGTQSSITIREDPKMGISLNGVVQYKVKSAEQILSLLEEGNTRRSVDSHSLNEASSRSHAILQLLIRRKDGGKSKWSKLSLIDLAGSEKAEASGTINNKKMLREGAKINRSLLSLANCINALAHKKKSGLYVPYRDSKLTYLLKDSLGGGSHPSKTIMIANVSPASSRWSDIRETLIYANRAKNIKVAKPKVKGNVKKTVTEYKRMVTDLKTELAELKSFIGKQRIRAQPMITEYKALDSQIVDQVEIPKTADELAKERQRRSELRKAVEDQRKVIVENFSERLQTKQSLLEIRQHNITNQIDLEEVRQQIRKAETESLRSWGSIVSQRMGSTDELPPLNKRTSSTDTEKALSDGNQDELLDENKDIAPHPPMQDLSESDYSDSEYPGDSISVLDRNPSFPLFAAEEAMVMTKRKRKLLQRKNTSIFKPDKINQLKLREEALSASIVDNKHLAVVLEARLQGLERDADYHLQCVGKLSDALKKKSDEISVYGREVLHLTLERCEMELETMQAHFEATILQHIVQKQQDIMASQLRKIKDLKQIIRDPHGCSNCGHLEILDPVVSEMVMSDIESDSSADEVVDENLTFGAYFMTEMDDQPPRPKPKTSFVMIKEIADNAIDTRSSGFNRTASLSSSDGSLVYKTLSRDASDDLSRIDESPTKESANKLAISESPSTSPDKRLTPERPDAPSSNTNKSSLASVGRQNSLGDGVEFMSFFGSD